MLRPWATLTIFGFKTFIFPFTAPNALCDHLTNLKLILWPTSVDTRITATPSIVVSSSKPHFTFELTVEVMIQDNTSCRLISLILKSRAILFPVNSFYQRPLVANWWLGRLFTSSIPLFSKIHIDRNLEVDMAVATWDYMRLLTLNPKLWTTFSFHLFHL
jgi:hypothetical protein